MCKTPRFPSQMNVSPLPETEDLGVVNICKHGFAMTVKAGKEGKQQNGANSHISTNKNINR